MINRKQLERLNDVGYVGDSLLTEKDLMEMIADDMLYIYPPVQDVQGWTIAISGEDSIEDDDLTEGLVRTLVKVYEMQRKNKEKQ